MEEVEGSLGHREKLLKGGALEEDRRVRGQQVATCKLPPTSWASAGGEASRLEVRDLCSLSALVAV